MLNVKRQTLTINRQPSTINYISKQRTTNNELQSTINQQPAFLHIAGWRLHLYIRLRQSLSRTTEVRRNQNA